MKEKKTRRTSLASKVEAAFREAAKKVILKAKQTDTPIIIWKEGRVAAVSVEKIESVQSEPAPITIN
jgi:hypothetical protein